MTKAIVELHNIKGLGSTFLFIYGLCHLYVEAI